MCSRTQKKRAVTPQETEPDLPVSVRESPAEMWVHSGLLRGQRHWLQQSWELWHAGISPFEGGHHYSHYSYHSLASGQTNREGTQPQPWTENWIKDLLMSSLMSDSFWPHGLQHARLPCPSPTPRVYSDSCPLSWWCHPTISSSVIPFSSCLQSFPVSGSFQMSQFFASGGQSIGVSASASVLPMNIQECFL